MLTRVGILLLLAHACGGSFVGRCAGRIDASTRSRPICAAEWPMFDYESAATVERAADGAGEPLEPSAASTLRELSQAFDYDGASEAQTLEAADFVLAQLRAEAADIRGSGILGGIVESAFSATSLADALGAVLAPKLARPEDGTSGVAQFHEACYRPPRPPRPPRHPHPPLPSSRAATWRRCSRARCARRPCSARLWRTCSKCTRSIPRRTAC